MTEDRCRWNGTNQPREEWRPVVGYEGHYEVSNTGQVMSLKYGKPRLMKGGSTDDGYPKVYLWLNGGGIHKTRHALVAAAFIGPRPSGQEVRHLDGDKLNIAVENLAYGTRAENTQDQVRHGTHNFLRTSDACKWGHPWTEENTRIGPNSAGRVVRACRACCAQRMRESRVKGKAAA